MKSEKSKKKTILLIDDETDWLNAMSSALEDSSFSLIVAESGEAALEKMNKSLPDLILSDVRMPVVNGFELFEKIRSNPKYKSIPFVFMSSIDDFDAIHAAKQLGVDDYVTKPFDSQDAKNVVEKLMKQFNI